jgi:hypothetical protein
MGILNTHYDRGSAGRCSNCCMVFLVYVYALGRLWSWLACLHIKHYELSELIQRVEISNYEVITSFHDRCHACRVRMTRMRSHLSVRRGDPPGETKPEADLAHLLLDTSDRATSTFVTFQP